MQLTMNQRKATMQIEDIKSQILVMDETIVVVCFYEENIEFVEALVEMGYFDHSNENTQETMQHL